MKGMRKSRSQLKRRVWVAAVMVIIVVIAAVSIGGYYFMTGGKEVVTPPREMYTYTSYTWGGIDNQEFFSAWQEVKDIGETEFVAAENSYSVLVLMHPYTVGAFNPSTAEWIIIVSSIPEASNEAKVAIIRLDFQTFHLKKAYKFSYVVQPGLTLDDVIATMEGKIAEVEGGVREIGSHEVELLGGNYIYSYPAGDFGGTIVVNKYVGEPIFYATTVWDGAGALIIPEP